MSQLAAHLLLQSVPWYPEAQREQVPSERQEAQLLTEQGEQVVRVVR